MNTSKKSSLTHLALALCAIAIAMAININATAHSVWIEPKGDQLVVRFAEPGEDFEASPGFLDNLSVPVVFQIITNTPVRVDAIKRGDCFLLKGASNANSVCAESTFTVRAGRKPIFYARWAPSEGAASPPLLTMDIVPTGKTGEVRAFFRGEPLPGAKATLHKPGGKDEDLVADDSGLFQFKDEAPGQYLLTIAHHREPIPGFHAGLPYKETSHNCALVWIRK